MSHNAFTLKGTVASAEIAFLGSWQQSDKPVKVYGVRVNPFRVVRPCSGKSQASMSACGRFGCLWRSWGIFTDRVEGAGGIPLTLTPTSIRATSAAYKAYKTGLFLWFGIGLHMNHWGLCLILAIGMIVPLGRKIIYQISNP